MFLNAGIEISKDELKKLFSIVDTDGSGSISLDEFKQFSSNSMANKIFRKLMQRVRKVQELNHSGRDNVKPYIPFNLNDLLDHLSHMSKR